MKRFKKFKPAFWEHYNLYSSHPHTTINFARKWKLIVLFTSFMALLPLFVMTLVELSLTRQMIENEVKSNISQILNLTASSLMQSIDREKIIIDNIIKSQGQKEPGTADNIDTISKTILSYSNDILDISIIDEDKKTATDTAISNLTSLSVDDLMPKVIANRIYLTHITLENNSSPDLILLTSSLNNQNHPVFFKIRFDKKILSRTLAPLKPAKNNDIFIIDQDKSLLSGSFYFGQPGRDKPFTLEQFNENLGIENLITPSGTPVIAGYTKIPNSSLIIVLVKSKKWITNLYLKPRHQLVGYLIVSIIIILLSIMGTATYLVGRIHAADRKRIEALRHVEYANKLASIGRLASGVAHEINNPLAIINQKTGLIIDLFMLREDLASDERLIPLANDVLDAVRRCGTITRQLLDFARHMEFNIQIVDIWEVINQVLVFLEKEAEHRNLTIVVDNKHTIDHFECDRGSLQQIFLNLFENAFAAMDNGGRLAISVKPENDNTICIMVSDNGHGIAEDDINIIFEPFYSSKNADWGAGLGLSITYGLIKELGGDIQVQSKIDKGTRFTITLPMVPEKNKETKKNSTNQALDSE